MREIQKRKNNGRVSRPYNRYCIGAKISEYKFLRILRGFTGNIPAGQLSPQIHISLRTVRDTYTKLRARLGLTVIHCPDDFGSIGRLLYHDGSLNELGRSVTEVIRQSRYYRWHCRSHAPRLGRRDGEDLLIEATVRLFCAISLPCQGQDIAPRETGLISLVGESDREDFLSETERKIQVHLAQHFGRFDHLWIDLLRVEAFRYRVIGAAPHHYAQHRFYNDFRKYLLKNPLCKTQ